MAKPLTEAVKSFAKKNGSLFDHFPEVSTQWDFTKNGDVRPELIPVHYSDASIWWKCPKCGREWQQSPKTRVKKNKLSQCRACAGQISIKGLTDLQTINPEISKEFHPTKNGFVTPSDISANSNKKYWWVCSKCGNEWEASVNNRNKGRGCNRCKTICQTSFPEQSVFFYVKKYYPDAINRYRDIFLNTMELDIYIPCEKIGIEYDGIIWHTGDKVALREEKKYSICSKNNIKLIRIREQFNQQSVTQEHSICDYCIYSERHPTKDTISKIIDELRKYLPKIKDVDVERDELVIRKQYAQYIKNNSIAVLYPEITAEWDYEKNNNLKPDMFLATSAISVWWKCPNCKISFKSRICNFCQGHRCKQCGYKKAGEKRKLSAAIKNPLSIGNTFAALEWDYEKNGGLTPNDVSVNSKKVCFWKCSICGYGWSAPPARRKVSACPKCGIKKSTKNARDNKRKKKGSLLDNYPEIAKEWDYALNHNSPLDYTSGVDDVVMWICPLGHPSYPAKIGNRTRRGDGCPICARQNRIEKKIQNLIQKKGSLLDNYPEIAKEWDYSQNIVGPDKVLSGSNKDYYWICSNGHGSYMCSPAKRVYKKCGCRKCSNIKRGQSISITRKTNRENLDK